MPNLNCKGTMMDHKAKERRPGRPRAIPVNLIPEIMSWYRNGLGYRAITSELEQEGILVTFSTVRRVVKAQMQRERPLE